MSQIDHVADRLAIHELNARYTFAFDRNDIDAWVATFTEEGSMTVSSGVTHAGTEALTAFFLRGHHTVVHYSVDSVIDFVDEDRAKQLLRLLVFERSSQGPSLRRLGAYRDVLVRTSAGWRYESRRVEDP